MFRNKITLTLTGLEDRTNPSGNGHPYLPPPPPAVPHTVVVVMPIVKPPHMPQSTHGHSRNS